MGIYIPGIEMPKGHNYVTIAIWPNGAANYGLFNREGHLNDFKDIEVTSIPLHGRLIDADVLADVFRNSIAMYDSCPFNIPDIARRNELQSALTKVINAPTVISAEPPKEE